jgi:hypothetical protein
LQKKCGDFKIVENPAISLKSRTFMFFFKFKKMTTADTADTTVPTKTTKTTTTNNNQSIDTIGTTDNDSDTELAESTRLILQEFLQTKRQEQELFKTRQQSDSLSIQAFQENWQLSQFWYSPSTIDILVEEIKTQVTNTALVACIACPSVYVQLRNEIKNTVLLEFDTRFSVFGDQFIHYDYSFPLHLDTNLKHKFEFIILDPPFLSLECFEKSCETVKFLLAPGGKILVCTGLVMEELIKTRLGCLLQSFEPRHANGLSNAFGSFCNYDGSTLNEESLNQR